MTTDISVLNGMPVSEALPRAVVNQNLLSQRRRSPATFDSLSNASLNFQIEFISEVKSLSDSGLILHVEGRSRAWIRLEPRLQTSLAFWYITNLCSSGIMTSKFSISKAQAHPITPDHIAPALFWPGGNGTQQLCQGLAMIWRCDDDVQQIVSRGALRFSFYWRFCRRLLKPIHSESFRYLCLSFHHQKTGLPQIMWNRGSKMDTVWYSTWRTGEKGMSKKIDKKT